MESKKVLEAAANRVDKALERMETMGPEFDEVVDPGFQHGYAAGPNT